MESEISGTVRDGAFSGSALGFSLKLSQPGFAAQSGKLVDMRSIINQFPLR